MPLILPPIPSAVGAAARSHAGGSTIVGGFVMHRHDESGFTETGVWHVLTSSVACTSCHLYTEGGKWVGVHKDATAISAMLGKAFLRWASLPETAVLKIAQMPDFDHVWIALADGDGFRRVVAFEPAADSHEMYGEEFDLWASQRRKAAPLGYGHARF